VIYPGECSLMSGIWRPSSPAQRKIRDAIVASPGAWGRVLEKDIKLQGESYVRVPRGYDPDHRYAEDLRRKDYFARQPIADRLITGRSLGATFETTCRELNPLNEFLANALRVPW